MSYTSKLRKYSRRIRWWAFFFGGAAVWTSCSPPPRRLVVLAGHVWGTAAEGIRSDQRIIIEDGEIVAVHDRPHAASKPTPDEAGTSDDDSEIVDWSAYTVLPGLIDTHVQLSASGGCAEKPGGAQQILRNLRSLSTSGVTLVADLGTRLSVSTAIREYVGTARHRGPRVMISGPMLTPPGGLGTDKEENRVKHGETITVGTPVAAELQIRTLVEADVDLLYAAVQNRHDSGRPLRMFDRVLLRTLVKEAHRHERRILANATTHSGFTRALECHVDAIAQGPRDPLDVAMVARLKARKVPVALGLWALQAPLRGPERADELASTPAWQGLSPPTRDDLRRHREALREFGPYVPDFPTRGVTKAWLRQAGEQLGLNAQRLHRADAPIVLGTRGGSCYNPVGSVVEELERWIASGVSASAAIHAATQGSASFLGLGDALGQIGPGYRADLIAVHGRPDRNIRDLYRVQGTIIDGVRQNSVPVSWWRRLARRISLSVRLRWKSLTLG